MSLRSKVKKVLELMESERSNPTPKAVERTRQAAYETFRHHAREILILAEEEEKRAE